MITIGKIPKKLQSFFKPVKRQISEHVHSYFWSMVLSICISHSSTIDRLVKLLRNSTHRTNHGEFLWRSNWDESTVMQQVALDTLRGLYTKKDKHLFFIIDDTQTLKRAKKMEAVGKLHHHATGKYGTGHTILKVCLYYRGVTIPWASLLYIKQEHAGKLKVPFRKLTELAGQVIRDAALPEKFKVTVLFDAFYLCPNVVNACLTHIGIKTYRAQGQNKSKNVLRLEPISKLKDRMRRIVWQENVQDVIKYSHEKPVIRRLEKLLAA